ncbi:MAG: AraC family transcriptional regulator [Lachnospiraceae bacterium]|nr:AraC family transcriptional regulator [Lachnospiraceae bacterium]MCI9591708.1 AraC family transcriptional regulator [Lachnospiraceae bacterium]
MNDFWIEHRYTASNYKLPHHYENTYQIVFLLAGKILYQVGEKEYQVSKGGMIVLNTLEEHTLKVLEYPYERYVIQIRPDFFQHEVKYPEVIAVFIKRPADFSHLLTVTEPVWNYLHDVIREMEKEYLNRKKYWEMYVGADLRRMFITIFRECADVLSMMKIGNGVTVAYNVMNYLNHHFAEDISVNSIAAALFLNRDYISHVFKDETGYSVMAYVISLRINRAKLLLAETDRSITDIAMECGYTDFTYFSKQFKKHTNMSPSKFRKDASQKKKDVLA